MNVYVHYMSLIVCFCLEEDWGDEGEWEWEEEEEEPEEIVPAKKPVIPTPPPPPVNGQTNGNSTRYWGIYTYKYIYV